MTSTLSINKPCEYSVPLMERLRVWYHNWKNRHVAKAYAVLTKAMRDDPDYAHSWQCNIAMPIYDSTRFSCGCDFNEGHAPDCPLVKAHDIRAFECGPMSIEQANYIADQLMSHLFGVNR